MNRNEVKSKLELVINKITEIEEQIENDVVVYVTRDKYLPGIGSIEELETFEEIVKAQSFILKETNEDNSEVIKMLGLTEEEITKKEVKIFGLAPKYWNDDIQKRLKEIRLEIRLEKLLLAKDALTKHLSDDDKFEMDTAGIDNLLKKCYNH